MTKQNAAGILFTDGRSVLLLKRAGEGAEIGTWSIPGGKAKGGEGTLANAKRETCEEAGLDEIPGRRTAEISAPTDTGGTFTTYVYRVDRKFDAKLSKEHSDWKWVPFDELKDTELHSKFKKNLPALLREARKAASDFSEWRRFREVTLSAD